MSSSMPVTSKSDLQFLQGVEWLSKINYDRPDKGEVATAISNAVRAAEKRTDQHESGKMTVDGSETSFVEILNCIERVAEKWAKEAPTVRSITLLSDEAWYLQRQYRMLDQTCAFFTRDGIRIKDAKVGSSHTTS